MRYFSGYVFSFRRSHADGGITFYEAKLGPWLRFLHERDKEEYKKMKAGQTAEHPWTYTGVCYADHVVSD